MRNIIQTDLLKTKQIKDKLYFYYYRHGFLKQTKPIQIFKNRINYLLIHQNQILLKHIDILKEFPDIKKNSTEKDFSDILRYVVDISLRKIESLIEKGRIPKKYSPTYIQILDVYNKRKISKDRIKEFVHYYPFIVVAFKEQIISLIEQKFRDEEMQAIARLLKDLNSRSEGMSFYEYIDTWSKEVISQLKTGSIQNLGKSK
jgi:hypothetical protein